MRGDRPTVLAAEERLLLKARAYGLCARLLAGAGEEWEATLEEIRGILERLGRAAPPLPQTTAAGPLPPEITRLFVRGVVPPYETSYETSRGSPGGKNLQMADIAGFYRAFGFQVQGERPDHLVPELEFVALLYVKEAYARLVAEAEGAAVCVDARGKFVREHLAPWLPAFRDRVVEEATHPALAALADAIVSLVTADAAEAA